jgi:hypothetical protein
MNLQEVGPATDWRDADRGAKRYRVLWRCPRCQTDHREVITGTKEDLTALIKQGYCKTKGCK